MTRTKEQHPLDAETIAAYRAAAMRPSVVEQVTHLNLCSVHHELLDEIGATELAAGAERAWLHAALRLAAMPAPSAADAHLKTTYLRACLDQWVAATAQPKGHVPHVALIGAAVLAEEARWGHPNPDAKPH